MDLISYIIDKVMVYLDRSSNLIKFPFIFRKEEMIWTADRGANEKKVTLKDISIATGFSVNTISHALADKPDISASTKQLIQDKAAELGYVGNSSASFLRSGISKNRCRHSGRRIQPHFAFMAKEIENYLQKAGYLFLYEHQRKASRSGAQLHPPGAKPQRGWHYHLPDPAKRFQCPVYSELRRSLRVDRAIFQGAFHQLCYL